MSTQPQTDPPPSGGTRTGFFHPEEIDGIWWWIDPEGRPFLSRGVNHVSFHGDHSEAEGFARTVREKYARREDWARDALARLRDWGFNSIGSWSDNELFGRDMPTVETLNLGIRAGGDWRTGRFPDVFAARFPQVAEEVAREKVAPRRDDPMLLGYFTDNELRWMVDVRSDQSLLAAFWELAPEAPGKQEIGRLLKARYGSATELNRVWGTRFAELDDLLRLQGIDEVGGALRRVRWRALQEVLRQNWGGTPARILMYLERWYGSVEALNARWGVRLTRFEEALVPETLSPEAQELVALESDFLRRVAERYFAVAAAAIRRHDSHHAILGCRYNANAAPEVAASMGDRVDVVSFNNYDFVPPVEKLKRLFGITGKPLMLTEFSFKAMDSGLPNTKGAGRPVQTQEERAEHYARYVTELMRLPYAIGFHWFQYADQPPGGRADGENSNYGLVDGNDRPWHVLTDRMREVHATLEAVHLRPEAEGAGSRQGAEGVGLEM